MVAEMGFEPHDLRVMSPMSYQTALPRDISAVVLAYIYYTKTQGLSTVFALVLQDLRQNSVENARFRKFCAFLPIEQRAIHV